MTFQAVIKGRLNGSNEIKRADRSHWSRGAEMVRTDKALCSWEIGAANISQKVYFTQPVRLSFVWIEPNDKRDPDNVMGGQKVILDALVKCGVIPNDSRRWIRGLSHEFPAPDSKNPRIEVTVEEDL